ncbi:MAG: PEP-CTERM sorting domain-containing protein [Gemmatimonadetes bacterium]|nr:PEP-CTERM sorting domain-containing protein [Gemmatimonadota bacterium]
MPSLRVRFLAPALLALAAFAHPAQAQLLHSYTFSSGVTDGTGTQNGTLFNGATVAGGYLQLGTGNGYVQFGAHLVPTSGSYSVGLWARENSFSGCCYTEMISQGASGGPGFYLGSNPSHGIRAGDQWLSTGVPFPNDNAWHLYTLVVNSSLNTSDLWIDANLVASLGFAITSTSGGTDTRLGGQFAPYAEYFVGDIDDVRIYGNAISQSDMQAWSLNGSPTSPVPEPATVGLMAAGLVAVGLFARRKRTR